MEENKTESTPDQDELFNYENKLPDDLTYKDIEYLRKQVESGLETDTDKSKTIKSSIKYFITNSGENEKIDMMIFLSLTFTILNSLFMAFTPSDLMFKNLTFAFLSSIMALTYCVIDREKTLVRINILSNEHSNTLKSTIKRNATPFLVFLPLSVFFFYLYFKHVTDMASVLDLAMPLIIIIASYLLRLRTIRIVKETCSKYEIKE
ncbi:hypothetical protein SOX05_08780 [Pseudomonas putida]|nr:hypothetical protein [Pseudomonas putida]MDY4319356.1 hypothetical protein [Pseudomonas putida]MDY4352741.1 hypothetical protein [Pseudomonas putida]